MPTVDTHHRRAVPSVGLVHVRAGIYDGMGCGGSGHSLNLHR